MKKIFSVSSRDEEELQKYREKHGINVDENVPDEDELEDRKQKMKEYDPWEDIRNMRMNFFFGSWVTRKFRPIGEDKLKKELEELEKKRQEEEERKNAGGR